MNVVMACLLPVGCMASRGKGQVETGFSQFLSISQLTRMLSNHANEARYIVQQYTKQRCTVYITLHVALVMHGVSHK